MSDAEVSRPSVRPTPPVGYTPRPQESLADGWRRFETLILDPAQAPAIQRKEMRRAFYAGTEWLFSAILASLEPGTEATANDLAYLDRLQTELQTFAEDLAHGRA